MSVRKIRVGNLVMNKEGLVGRVVFVSPQDIDLPFCVQDLDTGVIKTESMSDIELTDPIKSIIRELDKLKVGDRVRTPEGKKGTIINRISKQKVRILIDNERYREPHAISVPYSDRVLKRLRTKAIKGNV